MIAKDGSGTDKFTSNSSVIRARKVLELEQKGLGIIAQKLDDEFSKAIDLLSSVTGRIVVTGMGKSGHIAQKISSTLSSTGSPSFYLHPAEAGHGDLGMIKNNDVLIALSNSGETPELSSIIAFSKRFSIPLIGITGGDQSALKQAANITLLLPKLPEACPMGLAPTTSTTMMLALGDAIAVVLLERQRFGPDDFHVLHPGGNLGNKLVEVGDIMHAGEAVPLLRPSTIMADAIVTMTSKSFGCVGIIEENNGQLLGVITDGDLRRHMDNNLLKRSAREVMTTSPKTITSKALASEAVRLMNSGAQPITSLFVVDETKVLGIVHIHDCIRVGAV